MVTKNYNSLATVPEAVCALVTKLIASRGEQILLHDPNTRDPTCMWMLCQAPGRQPSVVPTLSTYSSGRSEYKLGTRAHCVCPPRPLSILVLTPTVVWTAFSLAFQFISNT